MSPLAALADAADKLEAEQVIHTLDRTLCAWRAEASTWRTRLAREHPVYSSQVIDRGICEGLRDWTAPVLRTLRKHELAGPCLIPRVTAVWLAGSIPSSAFSALLLPLLAGSAVYVKPAAEDPLSPRLFADALASFDPVVGAAIELGNDYRALEAADAVVAHGRDETIEAIRARVPASHVFVGYGHKLSVAAVGAEADIDEAARALALDVAIYDGRGCLSPAYVLVEEPSQGRAQALAVALGRELAGLALELPRGKLSPAEQVAVHELRAGAALRQATQLETSAGSTDWSVWVEAEGSRPPAGYLRQVPLVPVADLAALASWCASLAPHLSSIGAIGWGSQQQRLLQAATRAGASRLCPLGRMQFPPIDWNHDGMTPLRPLLRFTDAEEV